MGGKVNPQPGVVNVPVPVSGPVSSTTDEDRRWFRLFHAGEGPWYTRFMYFVVNVCITPVLLVYWSVIIYIYPCLVNVVGTYGCRLLFSCKFVQKNFAHKDSEFVHSSENAGIDECRWLRLHDASGSPTDSVHARAHKPKLFDHISPGDLAQGQLGDCWLIAALAVLAERPQLILNCFVTRNFNPRGKYRNIIIDDYVPCGRESLKPIYTRTNSGKHQMWPLLLEKAFAKMNGGYSKLSGGTPLTAMVAITGGVGEQFAITEEDKRSDKLFIKLRKCLKHNCLLACSSKGKDNGSGAKGMNNTRGIVNGHAYSILGMYEPMLTTDKVKLLKLRNPWGQFEWTGDWSDGSSHWKTYPGVSIEIGRPTVVDDGIFYMAWSDFVLYFGQVDILYLQTDIRQLHIYTHEELGGCGACVGCGFGLCKMWFCCQGCWALWREQRSDELKGILTDV
jgi:hypothetical protein